MLRIFGHGPEVIKPFEFSIRVDTVKSGLGQFYIHTILRGHK